MVSNKRFTDKVLKDNDMTSYNEYKSIMCRLLSLSPEDVVEARYKCSANWSSLTHLIIIEELESAFKCTFSRNDILEFQCFEDGVKILEKHGVLKDR